MSRAADFGIILEDVAITHLSFGPEVTPGQNGNSMNGM